MKRRDLIEVLERGGCKFARHGGEHDIYWSSKTNRPIPVKRHREIPDNEAREILKEAGLK